MTFLLLIKAPTGRLDFPLSQGQTLGDIRSVIADYLREFVFVDQYDYPISKFYQPNIKVTAQELLTIRFPTKKNTVKQQPATLSQIVVIDEKSTYKTLIKVEEKQILSQARRHIVIPSGYQSFNFLNKSKLEISSISQNNYLVEHILPTPKDKNIFITLRKSQVPKTGSFPTNDSLYQSSAPMKASPKMAKSVIRLSQAQGAKDKTQKLLATKVKLQDMIKQLDQFEKNTSNDIKDKNQLKQQKLQQVSKRLDQLQIPYSFKPSTDIGTVIAELKTATKQSQKLVNLLGDVQSYTVNQLASKAPEIVGVGYYQGKITRQNPVDFALTQFEEDLSSSNLISVDFEYKSQKAQLDHLAIIQTKLNGGSFSAMGGTPFFFIRTGASYDESNQYTQSQTTTTSSTNFFKTFYSLFTGIGLRLTEDNLQLKQIVISKFQSLFSLYITKKSNTSQTQRFEQQALQFLSKYGDQVQIGSFYFGNTFSTTLKLEYQQMQSIYQLKKIAQTAMAMSVEGGGIFQGGFGAAKSAYDESSTSAQSAQNEKLSAKYVTSAHQTSYPPIQNFSQWKEVVAVKNNFWKILGKNTKLVSLMKLLQSPNTIKRSILLKNQPIEEIKKFFDELQNINDTKIQTEQHNTRQFMGTDFYSSVGQMNLLNNPKTIQHIVVKRTTVIPFLLRVIIKQIRYKYIFTQIAVKMMQNSPPYVFQLQIRICNDGLIKGKDCLTLESNYFLKKNVKDKITQNVQNEQNQSKLSKSRLGDSPS